MNMMRRALLASAFAVSAFAVSVSYAADANVTGNWTMNVTSPLGSGTPAFVLKQEGAAVSGTYKGQLGEAPVKGTVKGDQLSLSYKIDAQGMELEVTYTGTVAGDSISGKVSYGGMGEGTFTGKKG